MLTEKIFIKFCFYSLCVCICRGGEYELIHINTVPTGSKEGIGFPEVAHCCRQPDMTSED